MEQQQQPKKRGRPKGSTKSKEEKERDVAAKGGGGGRMRSGGGGERKATAVDEKYTQWKDLVPILYDWLANHNLVWPSLSCRWGPLLEETNFKTRQRLYLSEQASYCLLFYSTDGSVPNTLVIANCEVVKRKVAAGDHIAHFNEESRSPFVKKYKTLIHPGEVNRIRELPQNKNIVATHTDCPEVLIWDIEAQPNRHAVLGAAESRPDLVLTGHQDNAEFALAMCPTEPFVLSGGKDKTVVLWSIHDHVSTLTTDASKGTGSAGSVIKPSDNSSIGPRGIFQGHDDTVEDVQFSPTRSADHSVCMFDRRKLTSGGMGLPIHKFEDHNAAVLCVQWCPDKSSVFGSSAEDGFLNIWDYDKTLSGHAKVYLMHSYPLFVYAPRDKVVDFHWNASDPWTVVSVSDDSSSGGGTLQIWRMSDLLYRPEEEVLAELEQNISFV
ncbi:hypothetical protein RJ639_018798 [Escallonia herrerae]|uniref:Histone-binding protein RBBP4-like N-terminal domain-containing protein n=1 Tax=Escallonia herrerae TaxID=1293975 RepID=A0AA88V6R1_9ASTE|nr:hypothetical protein RJ639_018798 [Escallonia herrerae]